MAYNLHVLWINEEVVRAIPFLADKIEIWHEYTKHPYYENGREFIVHFRDIHINPAQCTIESGVTTPLSGHLNAGGISEVTYTNSISRAYGKNLFF